MLMLFKDAPIKRKLMIMVLFTTGVVLIVTSVTFMAYEYITFRQDSIQRLTTLGEIVGANSTAALVFEDQAGAQEILSALEAEPHILAAAIYDINGDLFSAYPSEVASGMLPAAPGIEGFRFEHGYMAGFQPVIEGNKRLGTLYLRSDMDAMYDRLLLFVGLGLVVVMASLSLAYVLSKLMQKRISEPILALAETAKAISKRGDYSVQATKVGNDEVGLLTDAFNQMLAQIHDQDKILRESEERFRLMVASVRDYAIIMLDPDGRVVTWNAGAERIEGYSADEIIGEHFSRFHAAEELTAGEPEQRLGKAASEGSVEYESWRVRKDGSRFYANIILTSLRDDTDNLRGFCIVTRDITERRQAEETVYRLNAELEQRVMERTEELNAANKELESFCYSVSHDLRAPLRSIHGFSVALMEDIGPMLTEATRDHLERICAASTRMGALIDSLLYLSRLTRNEIQREAVDLSVLVSSISEELSASAPARNVTWKIANNVVVRADKNLLHAAMMNLLSNAWKYTGKRESAKIEFGVENYNGDTVYYVRDNGAGFDMTYSDKLFGAFQRLHSAQEFEGIGIGLATVQRVVHRHGGRIWANAEVDAGATFSFTL